MHNATTAELFTREGESGLVLHSHRGDHTRPFLHEGNKREKKFMCQEWLGIIAALPWDAIARKGE